MFENIVMFETPGLVRINRDYIRHRGLANQLYIEQGVSVDTQVLGINPHTDMYLVPGRHARVLLHRDAIVHSDSRLAYEVREIKAKAGLIVQT